MSNEVKLIQSVINSEVERVNLPREKVIYYIDIIENILGKVERDWDTDGYSVDFWLTFFGEEYNFVLAGDLWYDDEFSLYKEEK